MTGLYAVTVPKWGLSMEEGKIVGWWVKAGDSVRAGDDLVDIETTKITNTVEAPEAGTILRVLADIDETLPCGRLIAVIGSEGVSDAELDAFVAAQSSEEAEAAVEGARKAGPETSDVGGVRIRYSRLGEGGTPIVFLHGFGGDLDNWLFLQSDLAASAETISFDLPGHGGSEKSVGDGTPQALAATILQAMDALGVDRAHVVGHSFGAAVATSLAAFSPERVVSLTTIAPAGLGPEINSEYIDGFLNAKRRSDLTKAVSLLFADPSVVTSSMVEQLLRAKRLDGAEASLRTIAAANFDGGRQSQLNPSAWSSIADRLLVIWGDRDAVIPPSQLERAPGGAVRQVIEGAGHMPHLEKPNEVAAAMRQHFSSISA